VPGARCFVAVMPPPTLVEQVSALARPARPGLRWTVRDQWHVTLRFFASVDPDRLVAAVGEVSVDRVVARCEPVPSALAQRVWVLPVSGLDRLAAAVVDATAYLAPPEGRPFRGHLTLARARQPVALPGLASPVLSSPIEWEVTEIAVVRSELGRHGARHTMIGHAVIGQRAL